MKTIIFASLKGGVGKSTLAMNLGLWLPNSLLVDADAGQKSLMRFQKRRQMIGGLPDADIQHVKMKAELENLLKTNQSKDFIIIDTPGTAREQDYLQYLYGKGDLIITPIPCAGFGLEEGVVFYQKMEQLYPGKVRAVLMADGFATRIFKTSKRLAKKYELKTYQHMISQATAIAASPAEGKSIFEYAPHSSAARNMEHLFNEVLADVRH